MVQNPGDWDVCGYRELQNPPRRYRILDQTALIELFGVSSFTEVQRQHAAWVEEALKTSQLQRQAHWSESLAVGNEGFIERFQIESGMAARHREVVEAVHGYQLREAAMTYSRYFANEMVRLREKNAVYLGKIV